MKSIGLALIGIAAIIVSLAVAWHFIIYIPQRDKTEQAAEAARIEKQDSEKTKMSRQLQFCLLQAQETYDTTFQYNSYSDPQTSEPDLRRWNTLALEENATKQLNNDKALCLKEYPQN